MTTAKRVTTELVTGHGAPRTEAHDAVPACCRRTVAGDGALADLLAADPSVGRHLDHHQITALLDPTHYLGSAQVFIERAVSAHRARTR